MKPLKYDSYRAHDFPNCKTSFSRYTRDEIKAAWTNNGQGHDKAVAGNPTWCVVIPCTDENEAIILSALFVRQVFAIPTCTHWNGRTLSLYCGDAGSGWKRARLSCLNMLNVYKLTGVDERGPLFAESSTPAEGEPKANDFIEDFFKNEDETLRKPNK